MTARRVVVVIEGGTETLGRGGEGVRAALGLYHAEEQHRVRLIFRGEGVAWTLTGGRGEDASLAGAAMIHLRAAGLPKYVDQDSLQARDRGAERVFDGIDVVDRNAIEAVLNDAEVTLVY